MKSILKIVAVKLSAVWAVLRMKSAVPNEAGRGAPMAVVGMVCWVFSRISQVGVEKNISAGGQASTKVELHMLESPFWIAIADSSVGEASICGARSILDLAARRLPSRIIGFSRYR